MNFPPDFLFGLATAAYQIEGATAEDGRGPSIWDTFSGTPGKVMHGDTGAIACDHYHRWEEDLDLLRELGVGAYRFSIAWSRVIANGSGTVNPRGLDFYKRILEGLHAREIQPMVTLYHWDLPQGLQDGGGWRSRETAERFADYTRIVVDALGDQVAQWVTLNEPWCSAFVGHLEGRHAPGEQSLQAALEATHHLLLAHGLAVQVLRESATPGEIGITLNLSDAMPASSHEADIAATARIDGNENRWFLDPIFRGTYPEDMLEWYSARVDCTALRQDDLPIIAAPLDFFGVNYYEQHIVEADPSEPIHEVRKIPPAPPVTGFGIGVRPDGLAKILRRISSDYTQLPLYITENGATFNDYVDPEGDVDDIERVEYLEKHFAAARECIAEGIDLRGYFVWSFLDNFEWREGYSRRFGIVYVDFGTQRRIPKASARWYQKLIASQGEAAPTTASVQES